MEQYFFGGLIIVNSERIFGADSIIVLRTLIGNEVRELKADKCIMEILNHPSGYKIKVTIQIGGDSLSTESEGAHLYEVIGDCFLGLKDGRGVYQ